MSPPQQSAPSLEKETVAKEPQPQPTKEKSSTPEEKPWLQVNLSKENALWTCAVGAIAVASFVLGKKL